MSAVTRNQSGWWEVGDWGFDDDDADLEYINGAIDAWTIWRDYVAANPEEFTK